MKSKRIITYDKVKGKLNFPSCHRRLPHPTKLVIESMYSSKRLILTVTVTPNKGGYSGFAKLGGVRIPLTYGADSLWRIAFSSLPEAEVEKAVEAVVEYVSNGVLVRAK